MEFHGRSKASQASEGAGTTELLHCRSLGRPGGLCSPTAPLPGDEGMGPAEQPREEQGQKLGPDGKQHLVGSRPGLSHTVNKLILAEG